MYRKVRLSLKLSLNNCDDLMQFHNYKIINTLGQGSFSKVYLAKNKHTNQKVVLKKFIHSDSDGQAYDCLREIAHLKTLSHPNIISIIDIIQCQKIYAVLEYGGKTMKQYMQNYLKYPYLKSKHLYQLLSAVAYIHVYGIYHRDLKPENILITSSEDVKLCDFGMSCKKMNNRYSPLIQTLYYRAPEILLSSSHYHSSVDIWSIGCIFAEMEKGIPLFTGRSEIGQLYEIFRLFGTPKECIWASVTKWKIFPFWKGYDIKKILTDMGYFGLDLINQFLQYAPEKRISAENALSHSYFNARKTVSIPTTKETQNQRIIKTQNLQTILTSEQRIVLVDWIFEMQINFNLQLSTIHLAVDYVNRILAVENVHISKLQLIAIASLMIAVKIEEITYPDIDEYINVCIGIYTGEEIREAEKLIAMTLDYYLIPLTPYELLKDASSEKLAKLKEMHRHIDTTKESPFEIVNRII